jgi:cation/acetate symporter
MSGLFQWSTETWTYLLVTVTFMVYLYIGWRSRVRETEGFYVAGRGVPPLANGAATAADWMSAASFISMAGMISFLGYEGSMYLMGWTGGYVLLALLLAPYLRKFGKYTVPDFVGERYYSETARIVAAVCAVFVSLTYVAGQMRGVGIVFARFLEVDIATGVIIGMVIVAFFAVLGGMKGITWTQVAQYGVLILAYLIPAIAIARMLTGHSVPQWAFTFSDVTTRLNQIQLDLGFSEYTSPFANKSRWDMLCITIALMVGTAGLPHIIVRFYTVPTVKAARWSAGWALLFIALLYTTAPALAAFARYNLLHTLHGARMDSVEDVRIDEQITRRIVHLSHTGTDGIAKPVEWASSWQRTGLIEFVDKNGDGILQMNKAGGGFAEAKIDRDIIVLSTPEVAGLAPWVIALVAAGGLAAALSTASGLLLVISSSIAHDLYIHFVDPHAPEAKRVLVGRVMIILAIVLAGYFGINPPGFVAQVVAFAFGLAAASFFPVILMGIFDKRANREGAIAGMVTGLLFTASYIIAEKFGGVDFKSLLGKWYLSSEAIGTVGCVLNFLVALVVSRLTPPPPAKVQALIDSVRVPTGSHLPEAKFDEADAEADNP